MRSPVFSAASEARPPDRSIGIWPTDRKNVATSLPFRPGPVKYSDLAGNTICRGTDTGRKIESQNARWLLTSSAGPVVGTCSTPVTFGRKSSLTSGATRNRLRNRYSIRLDLRHSPDTPTRITRQRSPNPSSAVPSSGTSARRWRPGNILGAQTVPVRTLRSSFPLRQCHRQECGCCSPCCHLDADWTQPRCDDWVALRPVSGPGVCEERNGEESSVPVQAHAEEFRRPGSGANAAVGVLLSHGF